MRISDWSSDVCSSDLEGRGPATRAETKTIAYIISQMKAAGLQPGGTPTQGGRQWTQEVPLLKSDIIGTPVVSLSTDGASRPLTQGSEIAGRAALTGKTAVDRENAPPVFYGYGVQETERNREGCKYAGLCTKERVVIVKDPPVEGTEDKLEG